MKLDRIALWSLLLATQVAFAQVDESDNSLRGQFETLKRVSNNYQDYEVIKRTQLDILQANVVDSLKTYRETINSLNTSLANEQAQTTDLKKEIERLNTELNDEKYVSDRISFLGILLPKASYNFLVWSIIAVLLVAVAVTQIRFRKSNKITVQTRKEYDNLNDEFEQHRKRTRENETQLKRDLQTQINQVEELRQTLDSLS